jgi:hypothetical protein
VIICKNPFNPWQKTGLVLFAENYIIQLDFSYILNVLKKLNALAQIEVEILTSRGSAHKIETDSWN